MNTHRVSRHGLLRRAAVGMAALIAAMHRVPLPVQARTYSLPEPAVVPGDERALQHRIDAAARDGRSLWIVGEKFTLRGPITWHVAPGEEIHIHRSVFSLEGPESGPFYIFPLPVTWHDCYINANFQQIP